MINFVIGDTWDGFYGNIAGVIKPQYFVESISRTSLRANVVGYSVSPQHQRPIKLASCGRHCSIVRPRVPPAPRGDWITGSPRNPREPR